MEKIKGFGIRSIDDSREGVERFLKRNPTTSVVAVEDGKWLEVSCADMMEEEAVCIMSVWMRHTGRHGIGKDMVVYAMKHCRKRRSIKYL
mgnify:CR=1 FL=1